MIELRPNNAATSAESSKATKAFSYLRKALLSLLDARSAFTEGVVSKYSMTSLAMEVGARLCTILLKMMVLTKAKAKFVEMKDSIDEIISLCNELLRSDSSPEVFTPQLILYSLELVHNNDWVVCCVRNN